MHYDSGYQSDHGTPKEFKYWIVASYAQIKRILEYGYLCGLCIDIL